VAKAETREKGDSPLFQPGRKTEEKGDCPLFLSERHGLQQPVALFTTGC
jgi:hypothetical protein